MFTGLIEEIGTIQSATPLGGGVRIAVAADKIMDGLKIDDSVAINGVCQTVVAVGGKNFEVEAIEETLRKTTLRHIKPGTKVNLERALRADGRLGGHIVQGHVDCMGQVQSVIKEKTGINIIIRYPAEYKKWLVAQGSICINGVSLTVAKVNGSAFTVSIIPHTWANTILAAMKPSDDVNLEFDIIGKYVENLIRPYEKGNTGTSSLEQYIDQPGY
mgnify:CR=1 FL=1